MTPKPHGPKKKRISRTAALAAIERDLRGRVTRGEWAQGVLLPSRRVLAEQFGVDLATIQRAIAPLLADGTLAANGGRGTFVAASRAAAPAVSTRANSPAVRKSYQPKLADASLKDRTVGIVAYINTEGESPGNPLTLGTRWACVESIERVFAAYGVRPYFVNAYRGPGDPAMSGEDAAREMAGANVDAVIVVYDYDEPHPWNRFQDEHSVPVIWIDGAPISTSIPHICWDHAEMGYRAALHLIEQDCREFLFLGPAGLDWAEQRLCGARRAIADSGLPASCLQVVQSQWPANTFTFDMEADGHGLAIQAMDAGRLPDGVIAANDRVALGVVKAAHDRELVTGRDYLIVGFDDIPDARVCQLTSFRSPFDRAGDEAARLIVGALCGDPIPAQLEVLAHLVPRASTRRPAGRFTTREHTGSLALLQL